MKKSRDPAGAWSWDQVFPLQPHDQNTSVIFKPLQGKRLGGIALQEWAFYKLTATHPFSVPKSKTGPS